MDASVKKQFKPILRKPAVFTWIQRLLKLPMTIFTAKFSALLVTYAVAARFTDVLQTGLLLLLVCMPIQLCTYALTLYCQKQNAAALHRCKQLLYRQYLSRPLCSLYTENCGKTLERMKRDFDTVTKKYISLWPECGTSIIIILCCTALIAIQNLWLACILLGLSLLQVIPPIIVKKKLQTNYTENTEAEAEATAYILTGFHGFALLKLYALKQWWLDGLRNIYIRELRTGAVAEITCAAENALNGLFSHIVKYGTYAAAGLFVLFGYTSTETAVQAIAVSGELCAAVNTLFSRIPDFSVAKIAHKQLDEWFTAQEECILCDTDYSIVLSDITVHTSDSVLLQHCSGTIPPNGITQIKGENGSGKTTLFRLIVGLQQPSTGEVTIGGHKPHALSQKTFPSLLFYVPQEDPPLSISPQELYQIVMPETHETACKLASQFRLTNELLAVPIKSLSGGERKKVFLALGFAVDPPILLLDEPTNGLDSETIAVLKDFLRNRTSATLLITHETHFDDITKHIYHIEQGGIRVETNRQTG